MANDKPIIFFSHSSADSKVLTKLKDMFDDKTGGVFEIFLSSDGQSIPLGKNWIHSVEKALEKAELMVVFITPSSLRSNWLYFETGFAYSKGIKVVPVGLFGTDITNLKPPISFLQGFNILNAEGLNNLITIVNDIYNYKMPPNFTEEDYNEFIYTDNSYIANPFGECAEYIDTIRITINQDDNLKIPITKGIETAEKLLKENIPDNQDLKDRVEASGFSLSYSDSAFTMQLDPLLIEINMYVVQIIMQKVLEEGLKDKKICFILNKNINCIDHIRKLSARLFGQGIKLERQGLVYKGISFNTRSKISLPNNPYRASPAILYIQHGEDKMDLKTIKELIDILFEKGVIYEMEKTA